MRPRWTPVLYAVLLLAGCATTLLPGCATTRAHRGASPLRAVLDTATSLLGAERVRLGTTPYRADCSGFVTAAFDAAGVDLVSSAAGGVSMTERIYRSQKADGRIRRASSVRPGDLLFFHNTWDRNGNRLRDDRFTHIAVVGDVESDGTVTFFHFASGRVRRDVMNLRHRQTARDPESGREWNSPLRRGRGRVLSGQLFYRLARPLRAR